MPGLLSVREPPTERGETTPDDADTLVEKMAVVLALKKHAAVLGPAV